MTISKDDEREAREWLRFWNEPDASEDFQKHTGTILALLDRPKMPRPEEVPDEVLNSMLDEIWLEKPGVKHMRAAYRTLYDHYNPPPKKVEAWALVDAAGDILSVGDSDAYAGQVRNGGRIVRLVEADHD